MGNEERNISITGTDDCSPRGAGLVAGTGYILLFLLAIFANFVVKEGLIVPGDAVLTAENILRAPALFRWGMVSFLAVFLIDVFVAWGLFIVFRIVNRDLSLLAAWFRIVYTVFLGVALVFYFQVLQFVGMGSDLYSHALVAAESFNAVWLVGLTAFGLHLVILGGLIVKSALAPRPLGVVLIAAGAAYALDTVLHTLLADYDSLAGIMTVIVAVPSVLAEGWFGLWLLIKGGRKG